MQIARVGFGGVSGMIVKIFTQWLLGGVWWGKENGCQQIKIPILHNDFHKMVVRAGFGGVSRMVHKSNIKCFQ
jgi:hypothetical protein